VRDWATFGLSTQIERDDDLVRNALLARLEDSNQNVRAEALRGLANRGDERAIAPLLAELERPRTADDPSILYEALFALAAHAPDEPICRAVETHGRHWQAEQPAEHMADRLNTALQLCANATRET
jgi:HEAT repeat protein